MTNKSGSWCIDFLRKIANNRECLQLPENGFYSLPVQMRSRNCVAASANCVTLSTGHAKKKSTASAALSIALTYASRAKTMLQRHNANGGEPG